VLHELIWYDWFKDIPISSILNQHVQYGIVITSDNLAPWIMFHSGRIYVEKLRERSVEVGNSPRFLLPLNEIPLYLVADLGRSMEIYESEEGLNAWFTAHLGMVLDRKAVYWEEPPPVVLNPNDYLVLKTNAAEIIRIAFECSSVWCKW
jgi:hypothetical protein